MIFYIDNHADKKKEFSYEELINLFINNVKAYDNLLNGFPFERAFLSVLPGTPDPILISVEDWDALWKEFKRQVPKPNYKY